MSFWSKLFGKDQSKPTTPSKTLTSPPVTTRRAAQPAPKPAGAPAQKIHPEKALLLGLRPLGNKKRLAKYAKFRLYQDRKTAESFYRVWLQSAKLNPPPRPIEMMLAFLNNEFWQAEKYAIVHPLDAETEELQQWGWKCLEPARKAVGQPHHTGDAEYVHFRGGIDTVLDWDILLPAGFTEHSPNYQTFLTDDEENAYEPVKLVDSAKTMLPELPSPQEPEVGVLFVIERMGTSYGEEARKLFFELVDPFTLRGSILRCGDIMPACQHYCIAVRTASTEQAIRLREVIRSSAKDVLLVPPEERIVEQQQLRGQPLLFQGFVSDTGKYVGK